jgi:hypothetical protein
MNSFTPFLHHTEVASPGNVKEGLMADEEDDKDQDEIPEPPKRLFTLTEAERARKEIEPVLVEAMGCRKKLAGLESDLSAVSARISMMGGVIVPYEKLAAVRLQHNQLAETFNSALSQIIETGCVIKDLECISVGNWAKTASASITARTKVSRAASLWIRAILAAVESSSKKSLVHQFSEPPERLRQSLSAFRRPSTH